jgi:hypothetical protein
MLVLNLTGALHVYSVYSNLYDRWLNCSTYIRLVIPGTNYRILLSTLFYIENDAEIFPVHYTWKVSEKGFKLAFMMNKLAMNNSF